MPPRRRLEPYLHLYTLCTLVLAHPLLALLARYPDFFTARSWNLANVGLLVGVLTFVIPLLPVAIHAVLARRSASLAAAFLTVVVALGAATWSMQLLHNWQREHLALVLALTSGLLAGWGYRRFATVRTFLTLLAPALVAVPMVFAMNPRIARLGQTVDEPVPGLAIDAQAPIFVLVFDALSTTALMDDQQRINTQRYPHLAALADDSVWFPNATSVARWTVESIPAMLTGAYPEPDKLARFEDHRQNLFTLLGDAYRIVAAEAVMELCPPYLNAYPRPAPPSGVSALVSDLGLIWLHRTLSPGLASRLPPVDQGWGNFIDPQARVTEEIERLYQFLETFEADAEPTLYYLHIVFPHMPYQYLPSGKLFRDEVSKFLKPVAPAHRQPPDDEAKVLHYKRYLLQTGLVDRLIGDFTARLRALGLYDRSYVILTADHGGRIAALDNEDDIFFVPLIIKRPQPTAGSIDPKPVSTLDLLPSLLDLLDVPTASWPTPASRSFFTPDYQPSSQLYINGDLRPLDLGLHRDKLDLVAWKLDRFGAGDDPLSIYRAGSTRPTLLGERVENLSVGDAPRLRVALDAGGPEIHYDPAAKLAPVLVSGSVHREGHEGPCCELAIAVNGRIEATVTARPYSPPDWLRFQGMIAESVLQPGPNDLRAWVLDPDDPRRLLAPRQVPAND